jgi:cysteine-rich repeat protein
MVRCRACLLASLVLAACSDDGPAEDPSTGSESDADDDDDGPGPGSQPDTSMSSADGSTTTGSTTTADTTCGEDCPTTTGGPTSSTDTGSTTTEGDSDSESSSSEGPMGVCGDGNVDGDEECDEVVETATCDDDCTFADCGDEVVNEAAGEVCDEGGEAFACDNDCTLPVCGDGNTNESHNEICDGGGETSTCDDDCTAPSCGDQNQNVAALETCDDGNNTSNDGCSATCVLEGDFGGYCRVVDGTQWCFNDDACGEACEDVCSSLGLTIEPDDNAWFAAQDSMAECQAISDAFGLTDPVDFGNHALGCLEDEGLNDLVGGGLTGSLSCSSDPTCPGSHRTDMDALGTNCNLVGARRSVCPCAGEFCGNGVVEGTEICDDGNEINSDGCTTACSDVQALEISFDWTQFVASTPQDCTDWNNFRSTILTDHTMVSISGTNDMAGRVCTGDEARQICDALRDGVFFSIFCDGHTWFVDNCAGGFELTADDAACACMLDEMNPGYSIRPCINHQDWGGANTITCGAPTQTITVTCGY